MVSLKKALVFATTSLLFVGCVSNKPLSKEELDAKLSSTLNVYENNQVYFHVQPTSPLSHDWYGWINDSKNILALRINGRAYNAKDISKIVAYRGKSYNNKASTIYLKDGNVIEAGVKNTAYLLCDINKSCKEIYPYEYGNTYAHPPKILTAIYSRNLNSTPNNAHLISPLIDDSRAFPLADNDVFFLGDADIAAVNQKLARVQRDIESYIAADKALDLKRRQLEIAKEKSIQEEAEQMRNTIRVGTKTNCGTVFEVRRPLAGVQTMVGMQFIEISKLFGPSARCNFINNVYSGR